ncbi:MAG: cob(I)yrinic acid a,c-diamide adenosyltransferase [Gammaproteobacteria bacterium]|nr:cob(I)yrinic acid a,c-diamide adenosyltransferase [Gammaproteobacteria bacterium]
MNHRKIYTRLGDDGSTKLQSGERVSKDFVMIELYGDLDELNSAIGVVLASTIPENARHVLMRIQNELFQVGACIGQPNNCVIDKTHITAMEKDIDTINAKIPPLMQFITPTDSPTAAQCHLARAVCRRAERSLVKYHREIPVNKHLLQYMNRLSDLLFVISRYIDHA